MREQRQLGYAAVIPVAVGTGPLAPIIIGISLAASILPHFLHIGAGRKEADYLTDPQTGAQIIAGNALADIIAQHMSAEPQWNPDFVQHTISALERVRDQFVDYIEDCIQKNVCRRAGPGAIATIVHVVDDILIPDRQRELQGLLSRETPVPPGPPVIPLPPPTPGVVTGPSPSPHPVMMATDTGGWGWVLLLAALVAIGKE
jgi:hypothetical protein